jgi:pyruvate dehydrogenase E1 component alpha subunit
MFEEWAKRDPVEEFAQRLVELGFATAEEIQQIKDDARRQAIEARKTVLGDPMPDAADVEEGVYAD